MPTDPVITKIKIDSTKNKLQRQINKKQTKITNFISFDGNFLSPLFDQKNGSNNFFSQISPNIQFANLVITLLKSKEKNFKNYLVEPGKENVKNYFVELEDYYRKLYWP